MMIYSLINNCRDTVEKFFFVDPRFSFISQTKEPPHNPAETWSEKNYCKIQHRETPPWGAQAILIPKSKEPSVTQPCRVIWTGLYEQQHSWRKPKPSMTRSSLLTTVSEELWCALWQAPHLLTQGVSPGHAEVVTACVLGRRGLFAGWILHCQVAMSTA